MLDRNLFNINSVTKWLVEQYKFLQTYQNRNCAILRIADVHQDKFSEPGFTIQLVGKNYFVRKSLSELFSHENILDAFASKDIETIVRLKTEYALAPQFCLTDQLLGSHGTEIKLKDKNGNASVQNIKDLINHKDKIKQLSSEDAFLLGFLYGNEIN